MSVEFTLRHNGLDQAAWSELYTTWAQDCAEALYEQSGFDDEDSDYCYVAGEGSTRGFRIQLADGEVQFRLDALASTSDWHRCFSFCRRAIEQGGGELEREDGEVYPLEDLSDGRAAEEARADFVATLEACTRMMEQQQQMQLPTGLFMIPVGKPDLAGRPEEVMARIAARFEAYAYATAHRPSPQPRLPAPGIRAGLHRHGLGLPFSQAGCGGGADPGRTIRQQDGDPALGSLRRALR